MKLHSVFMTRKRGLMALTLLGAALFLSIGRLAGQQERLPFAGLVFWVETSGGVADRIYTAVDQNRTVACLNAQTGAVVWSTRAPTVAVGPVLVGSTVVYMGDGGFFTAYGLDAQTGKQKWSLSERSGLLAAGESQVYLSSDTGDIVAINVADGRVAWRHREATYGHGVYATPVIYYRGKVYTDSEILDASTGNRIRLFDADVESLAAGQGRVFAVDEDGKLTAFEAESLKELWQVQTPAKAGRMVPVELAVAGQHVFGIFYDGYADTAHSGELDAYLAEDGRLAWKVPISSQRMALSSHPIGADSESTYLFEPAEKEGSFMLTAFSAADGKKRWESLEPQGADGPPVPVGEEIYIGGGFVPVIVISRSSGAALRTLGEKLPDTHSAGSHR